MLFKSVQLIILYLLLLITSSCIVQFIPRTNEDDEILVVEGLITDQPRTYTVRLSKSLPLWKSQYPQALKGAKVWISDDLGKTFNLKETKFGTYITDSVTFRGVVGRTYMLNITTSNAVSDINYKSAPVEMKPVPPIDSIYYEKKTYDQWPQTVEGCQINLDTHDPAKNCKFFRWEYSETWEFHLPYNVTNKVCWISNNSDEIFIKNTSLLGEDRIAHYPLCTITNPIDRLCIKYSILVKQYSLNEDEYCYWESLHNMSEKVGGLYDMIPANIPSNIYCVESPGEKVLGYFSVSAATTKRLFIKDTFKGVNTSYYNCISDTIFGTSPIPNLNSSVWLIVDHSNLDPPKRYITNKIGCADCRARGSAIEPSFWKEGK